MVSAITQQIKFHQLFEAWIFKVCFHSNQKKKNVLKEVSPAEAQSHEHNKDRGIISNKMGVWSGGTHFPCLLRFCVCCLSGTLIPSCAYWWGASGWVAGLHMLLWTCNLTWTFDHSFNQQCIKIFQTKLDLWSLYCRYWTWQKQPAEPHCHPQSLCMCFTKSNNYLWQVIKCHQGC